jgi:hypothetical protein
MLTRREVEGELRSLGFRASARQRRADRDRARRFAQGVAGVLFGIGLLALLGAVNLVSSAPGAIASGRASNEHASEWVSGGVQSAPRRALSLFFTSRRTWHPDDPRGKHHRASEF